MKYRKIKLTESDIHDAILESIKNYLFEDTTTDNNENGVNKIEDEYTYTVEVTDKGEDKHFLFKVLQLKGLAKTLGIDIQIKTNEFVQENDEGEKQKFVTFNIVPSMPEIKVQGYKYIGSVIPCEIESTDKENPYKRTNTKSIVTASREYKNNQQVINILRDCATVMKCDGCHRERARGIYYCFFEEATRQIRKFGAQCAHKYFGIDINKKIESLFQGLRLLGNEPYAIYDEYGDLIVKYDNPQMGGITGIDNKEYDEIYNSIIKACMAIVKYGPRCRMKYSMEDGEKYFIILKKIKEEAHKNRDGIISVETKEKWARDEYMKKYPHLFQLAEDAKPLVQEFFSNALEFFSQYKPNNDFEEKILNAGLLLGGAHVQKKVMPTRLVTSFAPYCVSVYYQAKDINEKQGQGQSQQPQSIQPFTGTRQFTVKIQTIEERTARTGSKFYTITAITQNNEQCRWNIFRNTPTFHIGDIINISAQYNEQYRNLENVMVGDNEINSEIERKQLKYPEDGYRYKNAPFTIILLKQEFFKVKNNQDGCEYYINNVQNTYDAYIYKFATSQLHEGETLPITGTVKSYQNRRGETSYKLERVLGLHRSGRIVNDNDDYR
jgi:hypothetical protein